MMRPILIVADRDDAGARAAAGLARRRLSPGAVTWVDGDVLADASWWHGLDRTGRATTRVRWSERVDGVIDTSRPAVTWYRATTTSPQRRWQDPRDQEYAAAEFRALLVSWLATPEAGAVNPVDGLEPWGPSWTTARWRRAASRAGLPVAPRPDGVGSGSPERHRTVLVAGSRVAHARGRWESDRCRELTAAARCAILEISFDRWDRMTSAGSLPALDTADKITTSAEYLVEVAS
jgi:hypothetical protein